MKKRIKLLVVLVVLLVYGCQIESMHIEDGTKFRSRTATSNGTQKELIIYYPEGTTEAAKQQKRIEYGIQNFKKCHCSNENLELWTFPNRTPHGIPINIEEKVQTAKVDEEIEGVDMNSSFSIETDHNTFQNSYEATVKSAMQKVVSSNTGITIAVLDTGIDYNYDGFPSSFLYNSANDSCDDSGYEDVFGWNFVAGNNNPYDDYKGKHGTIVTHIITSNLDAHNVSYQILPVKIADINGKIKYFDALCGFLYATQKENVKVINMSFGWYTAGNKELLHKFINDVSNTILVVCSAGNKGIDTDIVPHYPSSYHSENILSIASFSTVNHTGSNSNPKLASFSNFGMESIDIAAIGENIPFTYTNVTKYVNGTSFSTAYSSFFSAYKYENGLSAIDLKNRVIINSIVSENMKRLKYSSFILNN